MSFRAAAAYRRQRAAWLICLALAPSSALADGALTAARAVQAIQVTEDPLETETILSTRAVLRSTRGLLRTPHNDVYLQAAVHRGTGKVRFEVHQTVAYEGPYRGYQQVNYEAAELPKTSRLRLVDSTRDHCQAFDSGTACVEVVAFEVAEADLADASRSAGRDASAWELKFKPELGREHLARIPHAEIQGLLQAVANYRATRTAPIAALTPGQFPAGQSPAGGH